MGHLIRRDGLVAGTRVSCRQVRGHANSRIVRVLFVVLCGLAVVLGVIGLLEVAGPALRDGRWLFGVIVGAVSFAIIFVASFAGTRQAKRSRWLR